MKTKMFNADVLRKFIKNEIRSKSLNEAAYDDDEYNEYELPGLSRGVQAQIRQLISDELSIQLNNQNVPQIKLAIDSLMKGLNESYKGRLQALLELVNQ